MRNIFVELPHFTEAAIGGALQKVVLKIFVIFTGKNTCVGVSFQVFRSALLSKEAPTLMFSCEYCEIFINIYFEEHLQTTASYFIKRIDTAED